MNENLHYFDHCDLDKDIEVYFINYDKIRIKLITQFINYPETFSSYLWNPTYSPLIDTQCRCNLGGEKLTLSKKFNSNSNFIMNMNHKCTQCSLFTRLFEFGNRGQEFTIEHGRHKDKIMKLYEYININIKSKFIYDNKIYENKIYLNKIYESDIFTNTLLSNWYIEQILLNSFNVSLVKNIEIGFICGYNGYLLKEESTLNTLDDFSKLYLNDKSNDTQILLGILLQLFSTLHILSKYNISIPNISSNTIQFLYTTDNLKNSSLVKYNYDGVNINDNIMLKLNLDKGASINVVNEKYIFRMYPYNNIADTFISKTPFTISKIKTNYISCSDLEYCIQSNICFIKLNKKNNHNSILDRYLSMGSLENSIYDIYKIILTLLEDNNIYNIFMNDNYLNTLWKGLWHPNEYDKINEYIKSKNINDNIILLFKLRCDVADYVWNYLKK